MSRSRRGYRLHHVAARPTGEPRLGYRTRLLVTVVAVLATALTWVASVPVSAGPAVGEVPIEDRISPRLDELAATDPSQPPRTLDDGTPAPVAAVGLPAKGPGSLLRTNDNRLVVDVRVNDPSPAMRERLRDAGAELISQPSDVPVITVGIAAADLTELTSAPGVVYVSEQLAPRVGDDADATDDASGANEVTALADATTTADATDATVATAADTTDTADTASASDTTDSTGPTDTDGSTAAADAAAATLATAPSPQTAAAACASGTIAEGDSRLAAAVARATHHVDGSGVRIGVLSDSFGVSPYPYRNGRHGVAADIAAGDLPGAGNPCGRTTPTHQLLEGPQYASDEGRAMVQILHDLAPGSPITFASAFRGEADFAQQIRDLADAGAKVIVDDVYYYTEPMYQDGVIAQAIRDVTNDGVAYFTAAGNANLQVAGRDVGSYEAPSYRPVSCPAGVPNAATCHDFDPGAGVDTNGDAVTVPADGEVVLSLGWDEPQFGVTTDYDVYVMDGSTVVASSASDNALMGKAFEFVYWHNDTSTARTYRVVIARHSGAASPAFKFILDQSSSVNSVEWSTTQGGDIVGPTLTGHAATREAAAVGAQSYADLDRPETYSSRGPGSVCWGPVVSAQPAARLSTCQSGRVSVTAIDGGSNSFFGPYLDGAFRFYGTSAAAPHAAAVAALQRQARPCRTPAEVIAAQKSTAQPIGSFGPDAVGAGLINATAAIAALPGCSAGGINGSFISLSPARLMDTRPGQSTIDGQFAGQGSVPSGAPGVRSLKVLGRGGVPDGGVSAVVLNVTATETTKDSFLTVFPTGSPVPNASNLNFTRGQNIPNSIIAKVGADGNVSIFNDTGAVHVVVDVEGYFRSAPSFTPVEPARLMDTRPRAATVDGKATGEGRIARPAPRTLKVTGRGGVPESGVTAVVLNVTATEASTGSFLTVYPAGEQVPNASNLNFGPGQNIPNLVVAKVSADGKVNLYNDQGVVHVVVDVAGYFVADPTYTPLSPARLLDTRPGQITVDQFGRGQGKVVRRAPITVPVLGRGGVPANGVSAVVLNVTATEATTGSVVTVYASGESRPTTSNLNFGPGQNIPNLVVVKVGADGKIAFDNDQGSVHLVADVVGWFPL